MHGKTHEDMEMFKTHAEPQSPQRDFLLREWQNKTAGNGMADNFAASFRYFNDLQYER
jgi:hypothetical protein